MNDKTLIDSVVSTRYPAYVYRKSVYTEGGINLISLIDFNISITEKDSVTLCRYVCVMLLPNKRTNAECYYVIHEAQISDDSVSFEQIVEDILVAYF